MADSKFTIHASYEKVMRDNPALTAEQERMYFSQYRELETEAFLLAWGKLKPNTKFQLVAEHNERNKLDLLVGSPHLAQEIRLSDGERCTFRAVLEDNAEALVIFKRASQVKSKILHSNLRLCMRYLKPCYKKVQSSSVLSLDDCFNEACLALSRAIESFDETRHNRFYTYANFWIKSRINYRTYKQDKSFKVPYRLFLTAQLVTKFEKEFELEHKRLPSREETLQAFPHVTEASYDTYKQDVATGVSYDNSLSFQAFTPSPEESMGEYIDTFTYDRDLDYQAPDEKLHTKKLLAFIKQLNCIDAREKYILRSYLFEDKTFTEVGSELGVSKQAVSQAQEACLSKIRKLVARKNLKKADLLW